MLSRIVDKDLTIFIISDFTGKTAETVINSVAIQFDIEEIKLEKFSNVSSIDKLAEIIDLAKREGNVILAYTLVLPELCEYIESEAKRSNIPVIDILGSFITRFSQILDQQPQLEVGLSYQIDPKVFERMNCVDFSLRCDDGKDLNKLKEADIVLIGVSRTSKTPLSMYLSYHNYKVANISLSPEVTPPQELYELPVEKIVGLMIEPDVLQQIRQQRLKMMEFSQQIDYAKYDRIVRELDYAKQVMDKIGCRVIDITNKSIEETTTEILSN